RDGAPQGARDIGDRSRLGDQAHQHCGRANLIMARVPGDTHVAVLLGGWSAEREVSLASGTACAEALRRGGFRVTEIDVDRRVASALAGIAPDVAFNALHGNWGEDGCMSAIPETMQIPYTHSGVLASALAMH